MNPEMCTNYKIYFKDVIVPPEWHCLSSMINFLNATKYLQTGKNMECKW